MIRTPHPATGVEHSIYCHLFSHRERNLVVAGANSLRAFRLIPELSEEALQNVENPPKMRLECLASWTLHAPIMSLQKVSLLGSQRDTLLISFQVMEVLLAMDGKSNNRLSMKYNSVPKDCNNFLSVFTFVDCISLRIA